MQTAPSLALHGAPSSGLESGQELKGDDEEEDAFGKTAHHQRPSDKIQLKEGGPAHSQGFRHPGPIPADPAPTISVLSPGAPAHCTGVGGGMGEWGVRPAEMEMLDLQEAAGCADLSSPGSEAAEQKRKEKMDVL